MHETHLFKNILKYLDEEEKISSKKITKVYISLSEFGSIRETHLKEHFKEEAAGTKWEGLEIEIIQVPFGPELEIIRLEFE
jgi:Zn finger protein HypA/HybF involved in hydrogenase expression